MSQQLSERVIVITGAGGGLGRVVCEHIAAAGASLALFEHDITAAQSVADALGDRVLVQAVDVTDADSVTAGIQATLEHFGRIDGLLHIAGGFSAPGPVHEGHVDAFDRMMNLNARGVYVTCGAAAKAMLAAGKPGSIVVVAAKGGLKGTKHMAAYTASKAAAIRIVESMAEELKADGIRVNAVLPSTIDTPANRKAMGDANAHKWVQPAEIAETMLFLVSDAATGITGASIEVSGRV